MTQIAVQPYVMKNALMTIDVDNYEKHVSGVLIAPVTSLVTWQGLTPDSAFADSTNPTWTCQMDYAQDWTTLNSLAQYLLTNAGQQKTVTFEPLGGASTMPIFTVELIIVPGPIGGAVNTVQTGTVTMGVVGQPAKTANV